MDIDVLMDIVNILNNLGGMDSISKAEALLRVINELGAIKDENNTTYVHTNDIDSIIYKLSRI